MCVLPLVVLSGGVGALVLDGACGSGDGIDGDDDGDDEDSGTGATGVGTAATVVVCSRC